MGGNILQVTELPAEKPVDWKPLRLHLLPTLTEVREGMMTVPVHSQIPFCIANAFLPWPTKITCGRRGVSWSNCVLSLFFFWPEHSALLSSCLSNVLSWVCFSGEANYFLGAEVKSSNTLFERRHLWLLQTSPDDSEIYCPTPNRPLLVFSFPSFVLPCRIWLVLATNSSN